MSEGIIWSRRERDPVREQAERDAFLLLLHLHNLSGGQSSIAFPLEQMSRDLAFGDYAALQLADLLAWEHFLSTDAALISITPEGVDYIVRKAGRRRSARVGDPTEPVNAFRLFTADR